jgi:hypothetical protein
MIIFNRDVYVGMRSYYCPITKQRTKTPCNCTRSQRMNAMNAVNPKLKEKIK